MNYEIISMNREHWTQVAKIYGEGIKTGIATFQTEIPSYEDWDKGHLKICRFVAVSDDKVLGWAALSPTSSRPVYSGVVEVSIYIAEDARGLGVGTALMNKIIESSEENDIWTIYSAIVRENKASIALHKKCGYRQVGIREKIAKLSSGKWSDTVIMERRSKIIGID